jgi:tetratricopeptide (TPR) repeat protein
MADESLTVFERRFDDWSINHPRRWVATTDRDDAARFISEQTKEIGRAQLEAADRIIVSQDRIASAIDEVGVAVDRVADGIEGLEAAFEWGFSEIVWHLEQERAVLKDILKVLQAPLDTQAKELRQRAEEAYRNGWIDDALEDFLESERKNRYDFSVHHSIGSIYLFHKKVPEKALESFEKAAKYATPKSSYHVSLAFLHMGLTRSLQEDYEKAYEATLKATELSPNLSEAHYQCAQYCAGLSKYDEAIEHLRQAIRGDRDYCLKAQSEKDFDVMRDQLYLFFGKLRDAAQSQAEKELGITQGLIQYADAYDLPHSDKGDKFADALRRQKEAAECSQRASLFDCWDATYETWDVRGLILDALECYISDQISKTEKEFEQEKVNLKKDSWLSSPILGGIVGGIVTLMIYDYDARTGDPDSVCALIGVGGLFVAIGGFMWGRIAALSSLLICKSLTKKRWYPQMTGVFGRGWSMLMADANGLSDQGLAGQEQDYATNRRLLLPEYRVSGSRDSRPGQSEIRGMERAQEGHPHDPVSYVPRAFFGADGHGVGGFQTALGQDAGGAGPYPGRMRNALHGAAGGRRQEHGHAVPSPGGRAGAKVA